MTGKRKQEGPDSARSWAIAAAACVINTLLSGISRATGLFYVALIETYGVSRLQANLPFTMRNAVRNLLDVEIPFFYLKVECPVIELLSSAR
ncbi:hypothetical protein AVEN_87260-1 [Araneus ventricosus]|uniref:Uncharacterized protein n=1 Tax=Araneus ventricosus TaxID=182803 RepID=A0A4Y2EE38_ARAVE|nr:hypothetical protein AVEN_87260-1 [Araneus ventricosus]